MVVASSVCSILVIDDDPAILGFLRVALKGAGYSVETARNGSEGLHQVSAYRPDLILLDMNMPVMDGWEFCKQMRGRDDSAAVPIVVMTAGQDVKGRVREVGAQGYLGKPFDLNDMLDEIQKHVPIAARDDAAKKGNC